MRATCFVLSICLLLATTGCWVNSLNPSYESTDVIAEPLFAGTWIHTEPKSVGDTTDSNVVQRWTLTASNAPADWLGPGYDLTFVTEECRDGVCTSDKPLAWTGHLAKIGPNLFLDVISRDKNPDELHWVPTHTFYRVVLKNNTLQVAFMDQEWLDRVIDEDRLKLSHSHLGSAVAGDVLLTEDTQAIRQLLLDCGSDAEAFPVSNTLTFSRKVPDTPAIPR